MTTVARKRFYKTAAAVETDGGGFRIELDGRAVRTPAGRSFVLAARALADAVAAEWAAQEDDILPASMPMTQLAYTALDHVASNRAEVIEQVVKYGKTDLLCYRAEAPPELVEQQARAWQPLLDWLREAHGVALVVTEGITPVAQSADVAEGLTRAVEPLDDLVLTALASAVHSSGSVVIGLAMLAGRLDAEQAFEVSQLDETHQISQWGEDHEAMARRDFLRAELGAAARFFELAR